MYEIEGTCTIIIITVNFSSISRCFNTNLTSIQFPLCIIKLPHAYIYKLMIIIILLLFDLYYYIIINSVNINFYFQRRETVFYIIIFTMDKCLFPK